MIGDAPDLSIVIPCFNESDGLDALAAQFVPVLHELRQTRDRKSTRLNSSH